MADIALIWSYWRGDWQPVSGGLALDDGLLSAVQISLFTDRRAGAEDLLPYGDDDRRGWWGDAYAPVAGDLIGSKLWLLGRDKLTAALLPRAVDYAREALEWMVEDQVVSAVDAHAEILGINLLGLEITLRRPGQPLIKYRFKAFWEGI